MASLMDFEYANAKLWLYVKPAVGLPVFLGAAAVVSLIVHIGVLTHTTWYPKFLEGGQKVKVSQVETTPAVAAVALPQTVVLASK